MKFRKKPVVIEAWQLTKDSWNTHVPDWLAAAFQSHTAWVHPGEIAMSIVTLEGTMEAKEGDWIIQGVKGELYPCKPDIFAATYEGAE